MWRKFSLNERSNVILLLKRQTNRLSSLGPMAILATAKAYSIPFNHDVLPASKVR